MKDKQTEQPTDDRRTLWLIEVLYADKGDLLELIRSKEDRMQISRDEKDIR